MDVLLVSGRAVDGVPHPSRAHVARLARELASAHRVRWVCLLGGDEAPEAEPAVGYERIDCRTSVPPFRAVLARVYDLRSETLIAKLLRADPPDVAHFAALGAAASVQLPWIARRLGVPAAVSARSVDALCHRGDFVDETGSPCTTLDDPDRCTACCLAADERGLSRVAAFLGRSLSWAGDASPLPNRIAFLNRLDSTVGALAAERVVLVEDDAEHARMITLGVPKRALRVVPSGDSSALSTVYGELARSAGS